MITDQGLPGAPTDPTTSDKLAVLQALSAAATAFADSRQLAPVLDGLLASVLHLVQADAGSIMLVSSGGGQLQVVAARGPRAAQILGTFQPKDQSVSGWALRERRMILLEGAASADGSGQPVSAHPRDLASSVIIPLEVGGRQLGVLNASRAAGAPPMDEQTIHLLMLLANQAAIVVDNAQLAERETATLRDRAQLLELAHEAILVWDLDTRKLSFWNPGAEALYGWSTDDATGQSVHDLLATRFVCPLAEIEASLVRDGHWEGELEQVRRDGSRVVVESRWALRPGEGDRPAAVLEINSDITTRKRAEARLHDTLAELQQQYQELALARGKSQAVLDATSEAIALVSSDCQVLSVNRRFGELFFGEDAGHAQEYPFQVFHAEVDRIFADPAGFRDLLEEALADPDVRLRRIVAQRSPERRELDLYSAPVCDATGTRLGRLYAFRDVTRERAADRMKSEFVSLVSHELRTPLTSINGYVDLLLGGEMGPLAPEPMKSLRIVRRNGEHLLALINDLLDASRVSAGSIKLKLDRTDVSELVRNVVETIRPQIASKEQRLSVSVPDAPLAMCGDSQRITQVLMNLLSNAYKYTPRGGQIWVSARQEGDSLRVDVRDTGIGLTPAEQAQLFTKFFRADHPVAREAGGTGLGLVITRALVELHGGTITVASAPEQGSTFSITMPVLRTVELAAAGEASPPIRVAAINLAGMGRAA